MEKQQSKCPGGEKWLLSTDGDIKIEPNNKWKATLPSIFNRR
jgi:hypothetical protein